MILQAFKASLLMGWGWGWQDLQIMSRENRAPLASSGPGPCTPISVALVPVVFLLRSLQAVARGRTSFILSQPAEIFGNLVSSIKKKKQNLAFFF